MSEGADDGRTPPAPDEPEAPAAGPESTPAPRKTWRRLLPAGLLLGAAVVAGVAWAVVEFAVSRPAPDAPVRLVEAPTEPYKVRPDDPGGLEIPNRDKLIYETLETDEPEEGPEQILPPPEEPMSPQAAAGTGAPDAAPAPLPLEEAPPEEVPPPAAAEGPPPDAAEEMPPALETPPRAEAEAAPVEPPLPPAPPPRAEAPAERMAANEAPERAAAHEAPVQPAGADGVPVPARRPVRLTRAEAPARESASWATPGSVLIELGASAERADMERLWERLRRRHETALAGRDPLILRTDRGERGSLYRLRAGPFADRAAAERTCARLDARGLDCIVVVN